MVEGHGATPSGRFGHAALSGSELGLEVGLAGHSEGGEQVPLARPEDVLGEEAARAGVGLRVGLEVALQEGDAFACARSAAKRFATGRNGN